MIFQRILFFLILLFPVFKATSQINEEIKYFKGFDFKERIGINEVNPELVNDSLKRELFLVKYLNDTIINIGYDDDDLTPSGYSEYKFHDGGWGCEFDEKLLFYDTGVLFVSNGLCGDCDDNWKYYMDEDFLLTKIERFTNDEINRETTVITYFYDDTIGMELNDAFYLRKRLPEIMPSKLEAFFQDSLLQKEILVILEYTGYEMINNGVNSAGMDYICLDVDSLIRLIRNKDFSHIEGQNLKIERKHFLKAFKIKSSEKYRFFFSGFTLAFFDVKVIDLPLSDDEEFEVYRKYNIDYWDDTDDWESDAWGEE